MQEIKSTAERTGTSQPRSLSWFRTSDRTPFRAPALSLVRRALEQLLSLALVERQAGGSLELDSGLVRATELGQQICPHTWQQVIALKGRLGFQAIDQLQARGPAEPPPPGN